MGSEFKNNLIVKYIRKYCKSNGIKLIISNKGLGSFFDPVSKTIHIADADNKSLSYKLFIIAHEYGHLFQYVMDKDTLNTNILDESIFKKLLEGEYVEPSKKKKMIKALLTDEYRASSIGLQLLKSFNSYPASSTIRKIKREANFNMLRYYIRLNYGYDVSGLKHFYSEIPNSTFIIPLSTEFNELVKRIRPRLKIETDIKMLLDTYNEYI